MLSLLDRASRVGPAQGYALALRGLNALAAAQTQILQSGYLRHYVIIILVSLVGLTSFTLWTQYGVVINLPPPDARFYEVALGVLIVLAVLTVTTATSRLTAIAALGVVGYGVALIFLLYGAPDLAMTQFLIETLTVILFVLMFYRLPRFANLTPLPNRLRDLGIAILAGGLTSVLVLVTLSIEPTKEVSEYYAQNSVDLAHGHNIVNTILVDWRALDTLGEITVLSVAAIGVFALLKLRLSPPPDKEKNES
jgi:multicomponent Na+:H+ antiporter subunit A